MKNQNKYNKSSIRKKLVDLYKQRKIQLSKGVIPTLGTNGENRHLAVKELKKLLDFFVTKDDQSHINMVLILKHNLITLLPGANSKFMQEKRELIDMLNWCEKNHTLDTRSKFFPKQVA